MAAEFRRKMSRKIFLRQCLNVQSGFHAGGPPGYGQQRIPIHPRHETRRLRARYEYKSLHNDRVVIAPASMTEGSLVRKICEWYATQTVTGVGIAKRLNDSGMRNRMGRLWNAQSVLRILRSERYIGTSVYSRTSFKFDETWPQVPREDWIRKNSWARKERCCRPRNFDKNCGCTARGWLTLQCRLRGGRYIRDNDNLANRMTKRHLGRYVFRPT